MKVGVPENLRRERPAFASVRMLADQAFSRAAGAPLIEGNQVHLLKNGRENYPAWFQAIREAHRYIHFECYSIHEDETGYEFADALIARSMEGIRVRVVYDWMGGFGSASRGFWNRMREAGIEVRCYNPPRFDSPLGWISRDHRKMLVVDGSIGFIAGLCVGKAWIGVPDKGRQPWRDTGIQVQGPAVTEIARAFAQIWATIGDEIPEEDMLAADSLDPPGDVAVRVVASLPSTAGMFRVDQLICALARNRLWLTDAYFAGTMAYVQALRSAAADGVDVRLLVPGGTDIPLLRPLSRAGYRSLLEAGVRVFEWNGTMLHAKTAVADRRWARVGSTNLNIASWFGNCELDAVIENERFASEMEEMYLEDLANATEFELDSKNKVRRPGAPHHPRHFASSGGGSSGRAAAGAIRIGNTLGAAFTNRRVLEPLEDRTLIVSGILLLLPAILFVFFPHVIAYPVSAVLVWTAIVLIYRGCKLWRKRKRETSEQSEIATGAGDS
jgi:cardiolipin synthase